MSNTKDKAAIMAQFEENAKRPFGMRDKIGYAAGDFANDLTFVIAAMFMMKFYTDVMGVSAALVGTLMMAAKVVDAFTDVAMGQIVDRSGYTAKGKFAPWIRRFAGPVAVASFLIFAPYFADKPMGFKIFWMFFTYILWGSVCYTGANIPYGSMASAMSDKPEERAMLSNWRTIGATVAQIVIAVILPMVVYTTDAEGHQVLSGTNVMMASGVCSILAVVVYLICYHLSTERVKMEPAEEKKNVFDLFGILFTNRAFVGIVVSALIFLLVQLTISGMNNYIFPNYFNSATALSMCSLLTCGVVLVLSTFVTKLAAKVGKKELTVAGAILGCLMMFAAYFIHTTNVVIFIVLYMLAYAGMAFFNIMCWAMIIDVIDDIEVKKNVRSDGTVYSVYSFARKLGQAAANGLTGLLLSIVGYTSETAFDADVVNGIYNVGTLFPAIGLAVLALSLAFLYPLSKKKVDENVAAIAARREK
jgi:glycoside/pentoside/hexuronide:cation symporter, GPH family